MTDFIVGFTVYTFGIIGVLLLGYILTKHIMNNVGIKGNSLNREFLKVEQGIALEARKFVYIVKAGKQKFLVATTPENVSFLAELDKDNIMVEETKNVMAPPQLHPDLEARLKYINFAKGLMGKEPVKR